MVEHFADLKLNLRGVSKETTYEGLKTSYQAWHGDMTDIAGQR